MPFQTQVQIYPAYGFEGMLASTNAASFVPHGAGGWVAGANGCNAGRFAWSTDGNTLNSLTALGNVPLGVVLNDNAGIITAFLGEISVLLPSGFPAQVLQRGDIWMRNTYTAATFGQKAYANLFTGQVTFAAAGAFLAMSSGTSSAVTSASFATNVMTVVTVTGTPLAVGQMVTGAGIPVGTYISSLGTGTGGTGTYNLTQTTGTIAAEAVTVTSWPGSGGAVCSSVSSTSSTTMTINTITSGTIAIGQLVQGITYVPAGTYIQSFGTFNGTSGTVILSQATTGTITAQACNFSSWIETPWYCQNPEGAQVGELVRLGIRN